MKVKLVTGLLQPHTIIKQKENLSLQRFVHLTKCFGGNWFASTFFSKYLAIDKNHSSNSSVQRSHGLFCVVGLWILSVRLDNCHIIRRLHNFNLGNQKSPRKRSKSSLLMKVEKSFCGSVME